MTPENVRDVWNRVTDMTSAKHLDMISQASGSLIGVLEDMKEGNALNVYADQFRFNYKDCIVYSLGGMLFLKIVLFLYSKLNFNFFSWFYCY